jgi:hypothetical protein
VRSDKVVTTFCDSVTPGCEAVISASRRLATTVMGEAMAPASAYQPSGGTYSGVGALLSLLIALVVACGDDQERPTAQPDTPAHGSGAADPALGVKTELDSVAPAFGDGVAAELTGDDAAARAAYEQVLAANDVPSDVAARAALHLAQLEARSGRSGRARDLIARATALAPSDSSVSEGADRVRAEIVAVGSSAGDIRPPKIGTPLPGVPPKIAQAFAAADRALAHVHTMRPRQRLAVWDKEDATADAVRRYRAIAEHGGVAQIAAEYRIGTLYHDLAIGLLVEPLGADLRRTLRPGAYVYLKKAVTAYKASLAVKATPEAEQWRLAAEVNLRAALDVLGEPTP